MQFDCSFKDDIELKSVPCEQLSVCAGMFRLCCTLELFQETALQKHIMLDCATKKKYHQSLKVIVTGLWFCGQRNWTSQKRAQTYVR